MAWVQVGIAAVGAVTSLLGGSAAEKAAKKAAREDARLEGIVTGESLRKGRLEQEIFEGQTIAAAAASGVDVRRGSPQDILMASRREFEREQRFIGEVGASRAQSALQRGAAIGRTAKYQGISGFFQSFQGVNWGGL